MTNEQVNVIAGIDTHADTHHVTLVADYGKRLGDRKFLAIVCGWFARIGAGGPVNGLRN